MAVKKQNTEDGIYEIDSDRLSYGYVSGTYSDQGCLTVTWDDKLPKYELNICF